ncbi:MAG: hypothetical protein A3F75_11020 [Betaproteobacteria bacterium RIFCSPLOWO2_12_FULL_64_23]|nr:MAG: hypothetical protein A3F75_11020 [Betaproteobacteria bacterium RIFCSPLOWO2_12_FULL_64_23]
MTTRTLTALERSKDRYGAGSAEVKLALLRRLERADLRSARAVSRLHEALCFLRAYPDDARLLAQVERMLARFAGRADLRRAREALTDTGIAGTAIRYRFFWSTLRWLVRRWPERIKIDRSETEIADKLASALPLLLTWAEAAALKELGPPAFAAIDRLRARGEGDAAFFARRIAAMPGDGFTREAFHDAIEPTYELEPGPDTPARTRAKHAAAPLAYQRGPLRCARPDLREELGRRYRAVRLASAREGGQLIELARSAMVTRSRDLDAFAYGNARDVRLVDDGGGLGFVLIGVMPERRALIAATRGYLILHNGVPIGYGEAFVIGRSATMTFNIFATFRGGEAAYTFARTLAMVRHLFGAESFSLDPYQLGKGNDEALASGAWWFYYKLGFRPLAGRARRPLREELARMRADPAHRSSEATLRTLAESRLLFDFDRSRTPVLSPVAEPGLRIGDGLAARAGGERERVLAQCSREAMRLTGVRSLRGFSAGERLAWQRWSPVVVFALPGVSRWSPAERRALARVIRAKGGRDEGQFIARFAAHPKLERALFGKRSGI